MIDREQAIRAADTAVIEAIRAADTAVIEASAGKSLTPADIVRITVDAILTLDEPVVTDAMIERAVLAWIKAPGDFVYERMRAALEAARD